MKKLRPLKWIPSAFNKGWVYKETVAYKDKGKDLLDLLSKKYKHSSIEVWNERLRNGELEVNKEKQSQNVILAHGDTIYWHRPPWEEEGVPGNFDVLFDNNDLLVINKPAGLPTTPGGGFLNHTLTELLKARSTRDSKELVPKPLHRLGRYTSGVLLCARQGNTIAGLSELFRNSIFSDNSIKRVYRALAKQNTEMNPGESIEIKTPTIAS